MTEPRELVLSVSTMKMWLDCRYKYLLSNIWRVPAPPNMDMAIGTAVHAGVEAYHTGRKDPVGDTVTALTRELDSMPKPTVDEATQALLEAHTMLRLYREKTAGYHPTMVEKDFVARINGVLVSGRIDGADEEDVHDTKTTANLTKFKPERYSFQSNIYRWGYKVLTGRMPKRLLLDVVTRNARYKQVEIKPDDSVFDTVGVVSAGILKGEFEPTGALSGECARCPYARGVCSYARVY